MQDATKFWDKAAEKYSRSPIQDMASYEYTLGRTRSYLKKSDHVLEVGCGSGSTALLLSNSVAHITASDISGAMIGIAKTKALDEGIENVSFVASDMFNSNDIDGTYDVVLALNLLHLIDGPAAAIQRIGDLLSPGGYFISKTVCKPGKGAPLKYRLLLPLVPLMQWFGLAPFVNFMTPQVLEKHITGAGFKIIETGDHPAPSRYVVAQKLEV